MVVDRDDKEERGIIIVERGKKQKKKLKGSFFHFGKYSLASSGIPSSGIRLINSQIFEYLKVL
ncbi:hypothetical protein IGI04_020983 [Brassica rapa subsp. trilocularis]|uniref:Uncharacterized protein n=1 Tax=Brassica rapa subsp. trilocularis TaxID=1813537 RepID=A0ABQ7MKA0_BRACM|nr:hypothetical protein IGI04_020983 [Brassica rapa subsp. trilocularis]